MKAFILCGGRGTRIAHVLGDTPKSMAEIGGKPFLEHVVEQLKTAGVSEFVLLTGHLHEAIEGHLAGGSNLGVKIEYSREMHPLGTGGALKQALASFSDGADDFLVLNGDTYFQIDLDQLLTFHKARGSTITMALKFRKKNERYGSVHLVQDTVLGFQEKPDTIIEECLINGGVYLARQRISSFFEKSMEFSFESSTLRRLAEGKEISGIPFEGKFIDIGVAPDYELARSSLPQWKRTPRVKAAFLDRDGLLVRDSGYPWRPEDLDILPGAVEFLRRLQDLHYELFIVSNQAGVARGYYTEKDAHRFMQLLIEQLGECGISIRDYRICPFHPEAHIPFYRRNSFCRKPNPGMILDLADDYFIDLARSVMVGDQESDRIHLPHLKSLIVRETGSYNDTINEIKEFQGSV